jgi:hypothetical protein
VRIRDSLGPDAPQDVAVALEEKYLEVLRHYVRRNWKTSGLDAGHFVEAARRLVDFRLFGSYTKIGKQLPTFNESLLQKYRDGPGDESYRLLIPRQLWALNALRNKRSIGHLGAEPANEIDATMLLYGAKWVLGEFMRIAPQSDEAGARDLLHRIIERQEISIWREDDLIRVLDPKVQAREQVLLILAFTGDASENELRSHIAYKNPTNFRKILKRLDSSNLIAYSPERCRISPTGIFEAEKLSQKLVEGG